MLAELTRRSYVTTGDIHALEDVSQGTAKDIRENLERAGLVEVDEIKVRGVIEYRLRLTNRGREVASLAARIQALLGDAAAEDEATSRRAAAEDAAARQAVAEEAVGRGQAGQRRGKSR